MYEGFTTSDCSRSGAGGYSASAAPSAYGAQIAGAAPAAAPGAYGAQAAAGAAPAAASPYGAQAAGGRSAYSAQAAPAPQPTNPEVDLSSFPRPSLKSYAMPLHVVSSGVSCRRLRILKCQYCF